MKAGKDTEYGVPLVIIIVQLGALVLLLFLIVNLLREILAVLSP